MANAQSLITRDTSGPPPAPQETHHLGLMCVSGTTSHCGMSNTVELRPKLCSIVMARAGCDDRIMRSISDPMRSRLTCRAKGRQQHPSAPIHDKYRLTSLQRAVYTIQEVERRLLPCRGMRGPCLASYLVGQSRVDPGITSRLHQFRTDAEAQTARKSVDKHDDMCLSPQQNLGIDRRFSSPTTLGAVPNHHAMTDSHTVLEMTCQCVHTIRPLPDCP